MQTTPPNDRTGIAVSVTEEQLQVGREVVQTGAVRLRKEVDEVPAHVREPVIAETADVQRVPVNKVVTEPPVVRQEGDVMVVPVVQERLVLRKELVLVEEIRITRRVEQTMAEKQVPLRRERVMVERFDPGTDRWLPDDGAPPEKPNPQEK
jgi:uncharacterized protein (TIGR02271 family)